MHDDHTCHSSIFFHFCFSTLSISIITFTVQAPNISNHHYVVTKINRTVDYSGLINLHYRNSLKAEVWKLYNVAVQVFQYEVFVNLLTTSGFDGNLQL